MTPSRSLLAGLALVAVSIGSGVVASRSLRPRPAALAGTVITSSAGDARSDAAPAAPPSSGAASVSVPVASSNGRTPDFHSGNAGSAPAATSTLVAAVDALAVRVARLDPEAYAVPFSMGCAAGCDTLRVQRIWFRPGEMACECGRVPSLKVAKVAAPRGARVAVAEAGGAR